MVQLLTLTQQATGNGEGRRSKMGMLAGLLGSGCQFCDFSNRFPIPLL
jgi:hypothetical protein